MEAWSPVRILLLFHPCKIFAGHILLALAYCQGMKARSSHPHKTKTMHEVLRQVPYNLFAIGVGAIPHDENAFIGSWLTQCSFDPPRIAFAVRNDAISKKMLVEEEVFTVNLLSKKHIPLARKLVKPSHRMGDKLGKISHFEEVTGAPLLRDAIAFLECRVYASLETGDHCLFVGDVVNAGQNSQEEPLTCADVGWHYAG